MHTSPTKAAMSSLHISRIQIRNYRNFGQLDVTLGQHVVVVGENKVGKSNFLRALRLVLDPTLPDSARQLRTEDFWDGLPRPLAEGTRIEISIDLSGFDDNDEQLASLADFLIAADPMVARLTYACRRLPGAGNKLEFAVYGGDREDCKVTWETRRRLAMDLVPALRDVEGDLASWRRSPLRPLLDKVTETISPSDKEAIAQEVKAASDALLELQEVKGLGDLIASTLVSLVGAAQAADIRLGLAPTEADRLLRSLRILIDSGIRGIGEASLGVANTLYLTLKLLETQLLIREGTRDHTFLAIEEPEAHLHPHVQRSVFSSVLRTRRHLSLAHGVPQPPDSRTVILTTHSPHVASVAPLRSLVLLRSTAKGTVAVSAATTVLTTSDEQDLERYLDVTRAEMLFARAVLLVEGDAELFLVPRIAELSGMALDSKGISVCAVGGTNFTPYVKFLKALQIPFAVVTDLDPDDDGDNLGDARVVALMAHVMATDSYGTSARSQILGAAPEHGVFLGGSTFEIDLLRSGRWKSMTAALGALAPGETARARSLAWAAAKRVPPADEGRFLKDIVAIGKGRFAQRLASLMSKGSGVDRPQGPRYVLDALSYLLSKLPS